MVYNLVRRVMVAAAGRQKAAIDRLSFIDAWRWLQQGEPRTALPELVVNRERCGRCEPRVRKRRPKEYSLMTKPRARLRKALLGKKTNA